MSTSTSTTTIASSVYDVEEQLLLTAQNYFFDGEEITISTLKPTLFGFMSESLGKLFENSIYHRNALHEERFLNTASMDSSIYAHAKLKNYDIGFSSPAKVYLSVGLREDDVIKFGEVSESNSGVYTLKLDKSTLIMFEDIPFLLPNSVLITAKAIGSSVNNKTLWNFSAVYDTDDYNLEDLTATNPYIKTWRQTINNEKWLIFQLEARQIEYKDYEYEVYNTDVNFSIDYDIEFENQLAGFNVYQKNSGTDNKFSRIEYGEFNATTAPTEASEFFYYTYPSDTELQVYFSDWKPAYNSTVKIRVFTTLGTEGNFSYAGSVTFKPKVSETDKTNGFKDLSALEIIAKNYSDSAGGTDRLSALEIKEEVIRLDLTRDNLITEIDLNYFFEDISTSNSVNGGSILFIKKRDDIFKRIFSSFILMKDSKGRVIPTNTVDLTIDFVSLQDKDFTIKQGDLVIYDESISRYRFLTDEEFPEDFINNSKSLVYSIPHLIKVKLDPFPRIIYYRTDVDEEYSLNFQSTPSFSWEVICNSVVIERNSLYQDYFNFSASITTNIEESVTETLTGESPITFIKPRIVIMDEEEVSVLCCFDLEQKEGSDSQWIGKLSTEDEINSRGKIVLKNSLSSSQLLDSSGSEIEEVSIPENFKIKLFVLYDAEGSEGTSSILDIAETALDESTILKAMTDLSGSYSDGRNFYFAPAASFKMDDDTTATLHKSLANLVYSDLSINSDASVVIKQVGVIGTRYYSDISSSSEINEILSSYEYFLEQNIDKLESNSQVDIKFYNTFGVSKLYSIDTVNIFLEFQIKLQSTYSSELESSIKESIISFVENTKDSGILSLSNLVTHLESSYSEIQYINIVGINGLGKQTIELTGETDTNEMTKEEIVNYVPEFLNVNYSIVDDLLTPSIKLSFT
jgi:hypothetical protein